MSLTEIIPWIALVAVGVYILTIAFRQGPAPKGIWMLPAAISVAFLAFTLAAIFTESVFGFWPVHTVSLWGNQVWIDLLLAVALALTFIIPQARAQGMNVFPWVLLTGATGCIGLSAMVARLLYLREKAA